MIDDLYIITDAGQLLYSWHLKKSEVPSDDDLLSGFLTALDSFASVERGEDIKSLKLKETNIIFEKSLDYQQKLTFVVTTKNDEFIELIHSILQDIIDNFTGMFKDSLNKEFDGEVTRFKSFSKNLDIIIFSHGLDTLLESITQINKGGIFKSIVLLEPKGGHIFYIHAKQFVDKNKLSYLIPLIVNSAKFLYQNNLNEKANWILLTTIRNENILVEIREKNLIVKQYQLLDNIEEEFLALDFLKSKDKSIKKPKKIAEKFEKLIWDSRIKQIFLVDLMGKIIYSKSFDENYNYSKFVPETISVLTSSKKVCEEIYNRTLFNTSIGGDKLTTISINFNNFVLTMIGKVEDFNMFQTIQEICLNIFLQIKQIYL
ncbi:hypothetical protein LCGC14_0634580 [marine sediment metagenome]|uniref:Uncharacterized protein n=1 Tax=marine sediment metagenome TaxID=412755 RepID=A0A0F9TMI8_9ZZZZ